MENCNECDHINITEQEQTSNKENHICLLFDCRVYYNSNIVKRDHNFIYPTYRCIGEYFKIRGNK